MDYFLVRDGSLFGGGFGRCSACLSFEIYRDPFIILNFSFGDLRCPCSVGQLLWLLSMPFQGLSLAMVCLHPRIPHAESCVPQEKPENPESTVV